MASPLDWSLTLGALAACAGLFVFANHRAGKPAEPLRPRLVHWRLVVVVAAFLFILGLVHLANLFGVETGPDKSPFGRVR